MGVQRVGCLESGAVGGWEGKGGDGGFGTQRGYKARNDVMRCDTRRCDAKRHDAMHGVAVRCLPTYHRASTNSRSASRNVYLPSSIPPFIKVLNPPHYITTLSPSDPPSLLLSSPLLLTALPPSVHPTLIRPEPITTRHPERTLRTPRPHVAAPSGRGRGQKSQIGTLGRCSVAGRRHLGRLSLKQ